MSVTVEPCRRINVAAFRGDRSAAFFARFQRRQNDKDRGIGSGPTRSECLYDAGHAAISMDNGPTLHGFSPDRSGLTTRQLFDRLRNGDALPGVVSDDTQMFEDAVDDGLTVHTIEIVLPQSRFEMLDAVLADEIQRSRFTYGFPNGEGDCNCVTWMERIGVPLLTGLMTEFAGLLTTTFLPTRQFGACRRP